MVDIFFEELKIRKPDYLLHINSSKHTDLMPPIIEKIEKINPDYIIVYGDTNSTLIPALAAKKLNKKIIHIEAGLRSFDNRMMEEFNRILTDHMSDFLFTPTNYTKNLLEKEGLKKNVFVVGNTVVDAVHSYMKEAEKCNILKKTGLEKNNYILLTMHRPETVDSKENLQMIINAITKIKENVIFPIHPRTEKRLLGFNLEMPKNVKLIEPVGYFESLQLIKNSKIIITDSGGIQEEAITLKVPSVTLRISTERMEAVELGATVIVGYNENKINEGIKEMLDPKTIEKIKKMGNPYGDGHASEKIIEILGSKLKGN